MANSISSSTVNNYASVHFGFSQVEKSCFTSLHPLMSWPPNSPDINPINNFCWNLTTKLQCTVTRDLFCSCYATRYRISHNVTTSNQCLTAQAVIMHLSPYSVLHDYYNMLLKKHFLLLTMFFFCICVCIIFKVVECFEYITITSYPAW